jgi:hypothetical protein
VRLATLHGIAARGGSAAELVRRIAIAGAPGPQLGLMHAALDGSAADDSACATCPVSVLREAGVDYWALGHAHTLTYVARGAPWVVYPGTPQGRGLSTPEGGAKGAVLVEVADGAIDQVTFEPLDRVRCLRVDLANAVDLDAVLRALTARAAALHETHAGRAVVLEAVVSGAPSLLRALRRPDACAGLVRALRRATARWEPFVWWADLRTAPAPVDAVASDDLIGAVHRVRADLAADASQCAPFFSRRFEPLRYAWTADVEPREAAELLAAATELAVDALDDAETGA